jgi:hypothetical protein
MRSCVRISLGVRRAGRGPGQGFAAVPPRRVGEQVAREGAPLTRALFEAGARLTASEMRKAVCQLQECERVEQWGRSSLKGQRT